MSMTMFPDFSDHGYHIEQELGHNRAGGRVTYLARHLLTHQQVVIKQFQFARSTSSWLDFDSYEREMQMLKALNHPGIPTYLDSFQTEDGFCMVQDYKPARSLSIARSFSPDAVRSIAVAALKILVYLQSQIPPVIHRDIKPENILIDDDSQVYLVDFGFARVGEGEVGVSSVVKGTLGFMPPEQLFNRQLTEASDLYGLGMTLICLLTATKSSDIGNLVDISYRVNFKQILPKLNVHWVNWLEKMVEPRLKDRFPNAAAALATMPTAPLQLPEVRLNHSKLEFRATQPGEQLMQTVVVSNVVPGTDLSGTWEVEAHGSDPPAASGSHAWITCHPQQFSGDETECGITVDTRRLIPGKTYQRQLLLHTNTAAQTYKVNLSVQTSATALGTYTLPYGLLILLAALSLALGWVLSWITVVVGTITQSATTTCFALILGTAIGFQLASWILSMAQLRLGSQVVLRTGLLLAGGALLGAWSGTVTTVGAFVIAPVLAGIIGGAISGILLGATLENLISQETTPTLAIVLTLLTVLWGTSVGTGFTIGFLHPGMTAIALMTSLAFAIGVIYLPLRKMQIATVYQRSGRRFIKP